MVLKPWQHRVKVVISLTNWIRTMTTFRFLMISVALSTISSTSFADGIELRPNDPVYVKMGEKVYLEQCASCHGVNLEGQVGWQDTMVDGMRLAPPHDKSGHTWHHPDEMLFNLTKYGFKAMINDDYKVSMPVYDGILSDEEIIASLSYIKSTWPDEVIEIHDNINDNYKSKTN
jgi:mono/diheme cytochrome c family protein